MTGKKPAQTETGRNGARALRLGNGDYIMGGSKKGAYIGEKTTVRSGAKSSKTYAGVQKYADGDQGYMRVKPTIGKKKK